MLPAVASAATYGGANLVDYAGQAVIDPTTDRGANQVNPLVADVAAATHLTPRTWTLLTPQGTGTPSQPTAGQWDACWAGNPSNAAPTVARVSTGVYLITYPSSIYDEVPSGAPGYFGAHTVNFRDGWVNTRGNYTYHATAAVSGNTATVTITQIIGGAFTLVDPPGVSFGVFTV